MRVILFFLFFPLGCSESCYRGDWVFWGDSLTARWHIEGEQHKAPDVIYYGFPGYTVDDMAEMCIEANHIVLEIGGNNILQGEDAATVARKIIDYKQSLEATGANVILVNLFTGTGRIGEVMAETNTYLEPDLYVNITKDDLFDYVHIGESGYEKWSKAFNEYRKLR